MCVSFSFATAPMSPALISGTLVCGLSLQQHQVAEALGRLPREVVTPSSPT